MFVFCERRPKGVSWVRARQGPETRHLMDVQLQVLLDRAEEHECLEYSALDELV